MLLERVPAKRDSQSLCQMEIGAAVQTYQPFHLKTVRHRSSIFKELREACTSRLLLMFQPKGYLRNYQEADDCDNCDEQVCVTAREDYQQRRAGETISGS